MAKIYSLKLFLKGIKKPLIASVRESESARLETVLLNLSLSGSGRDFFNFSSLDGKLYSINLKCLQGVNYLWDASPLALDRTRFEGSISIQLSNRLAPIETYSESPVEIYDFFNSLETDDGLSFLGFTDNDGELLTLQCEEIVYAITPEHLYEEGSAIVMEED